MSITTLYQLLKDVYQPKHSRNFNGRRSLRMSDLSSDPLNVLVEMPNSASKKAIPVKQLKSECKRSHYPWKSSGAPGPEHPLSIQRKQAKCIVLEDK